MILKNESDPLRECGLKLNTNGKLGFFYYIESASPSIAVLESTATVDDDAWHIVAVTRETSTNVFRLYLDGSEVDSDTADPGTDTVAEVSNFGNWPRANDPDAPLEGRLVDAAVIDSVMTASEITAYVDRKTVPGGMTVLVDLLGGTDSSTVVQELGP